MAAAKNEREFQQPKMKHTYDEMINAMKQSFEFWHKAYDDSLINYPLVWKKALNTNSEIVRRMEEAWKDSTKKNAEIQIQQFLELWYYAIRKSNFDTAKKSIQDWEGFWKGATLKQLQTYKEVLEEIEKYWKGIQRKNFE